MVGGDRGFLPKVLPHITEGGQEFHQDRIGGQQSVIGCEGVAKGYGAIMPCVSAMEQGDPVEGIDKQAAHDVRFGRPYT
jgi:hypothetical protein